MIKQLCLSLAASVLAAGFCAGTASAAGTITVNYKAFPSGADLLPTEVVASKLTEKAAAKLSRKGSNYEFLFWNVSGKLPQTDRKLVDSASGGHTFATAWYLRTGPGGGCGNDCAVSTWAFSLTNDAVMPGVTPIGSVTPDPGLWTSPSTTVSTETSGPIVISARAAMAPAFTIFEKWLELPNTAEHGASFTANPDTAPEAIAFYLSSPKITVPPPCPIKGGHTTDCHT